MSQPLLHIIEEYAKQTGNHCGLTVVQLMHRADLTYPEVKAELTRLYHEGEIQGPREGIHGKLIFKSE